MSSFLKNIEPVWRDRKRILGLPISFTRYALDTQRLYVSIGFFKTVTNELLLYRILDITSSRTLGQKMFGVGDVALQSADKSHPVLVLQNVRHPEKVRRMLSTMVEELREAQGIRGREMYAAAVGGAGFEDVDGNGIPDRFE